MLEDYERERERELAAEPTLYFNSTFKLCPVENIRNFCR
jgi:hypothetical protein